MAMKEKISKPFLNWTVNISKSGYNQNNWQSNIPVMTGVSILLFFGKYLYLTIQNIQEKRILKNSIRLLFTKALKSSRAL